MAIVSHVKTRAVRSTSSWGFMIEENAIDSKHIVSLAIIDRNPVGVQFRSGYGRRRGDYIVAFSEIQLTDRRVTEDRRGVVSLCGIS